MGKGGGSLLHLHRVISGLEDPRNNLLDWWIILPRRWAAGSSRSASDASMQGLFVRRRTDAAAEEGEEGGY